MSAPSPLPSPYRNLAWERITLDPPSATSATTSSPINGITKLTATLSLADPPPIFPNEIWAIVFKHIDNFTLWTTCRALSQDLRAEAEREMRVARLPELCIEWNSNCAHNLELGIPWVIGILETTGLLRFSDDTALAHFRLAFQVQQGFRPVSSTGRWFKDGCSSTEANLHRFRGPLLGSLHSSDLNLLRQMEDSNRWQNTSGGLCLVADVYIGSLIVNSVDVPWKDINFAEEEISID